MMTVEQALRWANKLQQCESEGVKVILVKQLVQRTAQRCVDISAKVIEDEFCSESAWAAGDCIAERIRAEFGIEGRVNPL